MIENKVSLADYNYKIFRNSTTHPISRVQINSKITKSFTLKNIDLKKGEVKCVK
jgi:hypothetical protein